MEGFMIINGGNMPSSQETVQILLRISRAIVKKAAELFNEGSGTSLTILSQEDYIEDDFPGCIDQLPEGSAEWEWANAVLGFLRFVAAIHDHAASSVNPDYFTLTDEND